MIETTRLILRPYVIDDYDAYCAMISDSVVSRHLGPTVTAEDAWNRVLKYIGHWATFSFGMFAVLEKESGCFLGETGFARSRRGLGERFDRVPEAAWVFTRKAHGRGIASEAATAAHDWLRSSTGTTRTFCMTPAGHASSLGLAERLGYRPSGEAVYKGQLLRILERGLADER